MANLTPKGYTADHSTDSPEVSILMPCFNVENTVDETVISLLDQTFCSFELVAVDDGSTDGTLERLNRWAESDARVRVLPCEHGGIIPALNAGLDVCRAPLIARMDADDRAHPERLAKQKALLDAHPEIALAGTLVAGFPADSVREGFRIYIDWLNHLVSHEDIVREIFIESPFAHPSVMVRRGWLERVGGYQEHGWPEDYDLWLRMYLAGAQFAKVPEVLLYWREHAHRLTRTDSRYSVENFLRAKAHYLCRGPLLGRDAVIVWGAGQMGRRFSKHLLKEGAPLQAFVDVDPKKIGRTRRGFPIIPKEHLQEWFRRYERPVVLAAVGARQARVLIRENLQGMGLEEAVDWWAVA
jgi:glycosyltransferase involved in cell wall biosynthesis